ncbi:hypothetical protein chiPu_0004369 [Chiloscyllium punctatum]|uniref:Uncharacterized protein n=1 Tax=Chiloscyllium punctatum TaxID=137246 RepID=A0A401S6D6_CHIPU|nr:hypothetical protein [Chiloscyllium punctatum]
MSFSVSPYFLVGSQSRRQQQRQQQLGAQTKEAVDVPGQNSGSQEYRETGLGPGAESGRLWNGGVVRPNGS